MSDSLTYLIIGQEFVGERDDVDIEQYNDYVVIVMVQNLFVLVMITV